MDNKNVHHHDMSDDEIIKAFNNARISKLNVVRPKIYVKKELIFLTVSIIILTAYILLVSKTGGSSDKPGSGLIIIAGVIVFAVTQLKNILLILIFLYQKFAPGFVRAACVFQPCCSEYMRLSIMKYGVCRGVVKGLKRIRRCHPPNRGIDEP